MKFTQIIYFILFVVSFGYAQTVKYPSIALTINEAKFYKKTNSLYQDNSGYLWLGTINGLYRYNGYGIEKYQYDVFDENSLPNNNINSIVEDNYGNLWLGSESYLIYYDRANNIFKGFYKDRTSKILGKSSDGTVWSFTQKIGLIKITPKKELEKSKLNTEFNYQQKNNIFNSRIQVNQYLQDNYTRNWFATSKGLIVLDHKLNNRTTNFKKNTIAIHKSDSNNFLVATKKSIYCLKYNKKNYKIKVVSNYPIDVFKNGKKNEIIINTLTVDTNGSTLWIGTNLGLIKGVKESNKYVFTKVNEKKNLNNQINTTLIDSFDNLWIGSQRGVSKLAGKSSLFKNYKLGGDLTNTFSSLLLSENKNQLLVAFKNNGVFRYNIKTKTTERFLTGNKEIYFIKHTNNNEELFIGYGNTLIQTQNYSINKLQPKVKTIKKFTKSVLDIIHFNDNDIWAGLWGKGIDIIKTKEPLSNFEKKVIASLSRTNVYVMHLDKNDNIWIGTRGNGLFKINRKNKQIQHLEPKKNGLCSNAILSIAESSNGNIWIGTRGGGLNHYNITNDVITTYNIKDGLLSNTISGIREDANGNLWISTDSGISFLDAKTKRFKSFGIDNGIEENQFSFNTQSIFENSVFFGTIGGFYEINTAKFNVNNNVPNTVITEFSIFGNSHDNKAIQEKNQLLKEQIRKNKHITLNYNENNLVVKFSSLDFTAPGKNKYAYKLVGVNDFWVNTDGSNRSANYNNLPNGDYIFKVKSSNSDGVWNHKPISLSFSIAPPFWKSNTALFIYTILILLAIYAAFLLVRKWYRLKQNLVAETVSRQKDNEYHRMRMVFFTDISHELRTPLTLIRGTVEKAINDTNFTLNAHSINRIQNNIIRMNKLINQIMDIRRHDSGKFKLRISKNNIEENLTKIKNDFNDLARVNHIDYKLKSKINHSEAFYDVQILEKILFNLLSNAFKYTPEKGKIVIKAKILKSKAIPKHIVKSLKKGNYLKCQVTDTGIGISEKDLPYIFNRFYQATKVITNQIPGTGIGMELVAKLTKLHNGYIEVDSKKHEFTKFTFYLPVDKNHYSDDNLITTLANNVDENSNKFDSIYKNPTYLFNESENTTSNKGKPKVLLVEDNKEILNFLEQGLQNDFYILKATNGKEGYDAAVNENPELILSDILMPEEDGVSMLKRIKENKDLAHIPIYILSANGFDETKLECIKLGADDFIDKPFSLEFVRWKIKNNLQKGNDLKERYSRIVSINPSEVTIETPNDKFIRKLVKIIENSLDDNLLSVEYLASEVGVSRASLYRKLQKIANISPVEFIKQIRLKRATQLLKKDSLYVSEIAHMTGFNNLKYFSKCFKKEYGVTPTDYKKNLVEKNKNSDVNS